MVMVILVVLGLCFGSFINALVWRLYEQQKAKNASQKAKLSITKGRSMCPNCRHELGALDLIPVISWLWLRGKCRYCKKPISIQYPIIEALTAALFLTSYLFWPLNPFSAVVFGVWLVVLVLLIALSLYDLKWMILPNKLVTYLITVSFLFVLLQTLVQSSQVLIGALWGILCVSGLFYLLFQLSNGKWIGGGDVKLGVALGLLIGGPGMAFLMIFLASLGGSIVGLPLAVMSKEGRKYRLPFGPFLIASTIVVQLVGRAIINWYQRSLLGL